jgi:hypothetical protein
MDGWLSDFIQAPETLWQVSGAFLIHDAGEEREKTVREGEKQAKISSVFGRIGQKC